MADKRFTSQKRSDIHNDTRYDLYFDRSYYGTYELNLHENGLYLGKIAWDTNFQKINSVWEYLIRQHGIVWKFIYQQKHSDD